MPDPSIDELSKSDWDSATTADQDAIVAQVENLSSTGWTQLSDGRKKEAIRAAISERDTMYSGRMSRMPTLDGDGEYFTLNLAAHKMELAEGGEAQSESGEGGSVNFTTGNPEDYLSLTRYGQTASRHISYDHSISAVRTW